MDSLDMTPPEPSAEAVMEDPRTAPREAHSSPASVRGERAHTLTRAQPPEWAGYARRVDVALAASRLLPGTSWRSFFVTPGTLLRRHRQLVARRWPYRQKRLGRPRPRAASRA
jgi:hypothetical protein